MWPSFILIRMTIQQEIINIKVESTAFCKKLWGVTLKSKKQPRFRDKGSTSIDRWYELLLVVLHKKLLDKHSTDFVMTF